MTQGKSTPNNGEQKNLYQKIVSSSYYGLLGVHPSASAQEIRQAYRELSKLYHPDTTSLPAAIATSKFQELNEAYATLSNPERRFKYDQKIGYSRIPGVHPLPNLRQASAQSRPQYSSAYLDPTDRPLSPGELFALFILGITFIACLVLAIAIGITRGETVLQPVMAQDLPAQVTDAKPLDQKAIAPAAANTANKYSPSHPANSITTPACSD
ncbi:J domain-containing protein [Leptothermofonsia sp. ETS-13]|uniref:J domain-containing protein n=1 Tax=Leptothermofonsia sp. ETS-13 TaxID=3035696 RepID=UPI003BA0CA06